MEGRRRRRQQRHSSSLMAFALLLMTLAALLSTMIPHHYQVTANKIDKEDEEGVCKWEDKEGKKKCREEAHRRNRDPYLPDNEGGRYYVDDDDHDDPIEGEEWDVWKHGGKGELYDALKCPDYDYDSEERFKDTSFENIHTDETWQTFNRIYNQVIAETQDNEQLKQESSIPPKFDKNGFQFPIEIKFQPEVGRGVHATTDIPKGSLLYLSTNNGAFYEGQTFRNFLKALPSNLACDILIWAFVRWVSLESWVNDKHMVCVDLDEGSFINSANDRDDDYNMALGNDEGKFYFDCTDEEKEWLWEGCKMKFFASRDIKAGEEIRADYSDFVEYDGWKYLGL